MFSNGDEVTLKYLIYKTYRYMETLKRPARREVNAGEFNEFRDASYTSKMDNINKAIKLIRRAVVEYKKANPTEASPTILGVFDHLTGLIEEADDKCIMAIIDQEGKLQKRADELKSRLAAIKFCLHLASVHSVR